MSFRISLTTFVLVLSAAIFTCAQETAAPVPIYIEATDTDGLKAKDGQKVTVYGTTKGSGKSGSGTNFVNFEGAEFYLITFKSDLVGFKDGEPADIYDGKRLAVTGVVSIYKDKPQFKLTDPGQVKILEADEVFPPKVDAEAAKTETPEKMEPKTEEKTEPTKAEEPKKKPPVDPKRFFK